MFVGRLLLAVIVELDHDSLFAADRTVPKPEFLMLDLGRPEKKCWKP